ncbi:MAG: dephospho-CoA kinase [Prevotellaceae bacterium]|jgi:dephospho-CoA kinase|nr:dephospho-CoA kinase [Prevotellaceae bacterium]
MLKVGLTGGIGSGKSIVCKIFALLGVPVYQADIAAKKLYDSDDKLRNDLKSLFGNDLYNSSGILDRQKLAEIIFSDKENLKKVNELVHPAVIKDFLGYISLAPVNTSYVIHEAAILYEAKMEKMFDVIINVQAPENLKIERAVSRGANEKDVRQRIAAQWPDKLKTELSDYNIINDNKTPVLPQILHIHNELINKI